MKLPSTLAITASSMLLGAKALTVPPRDPGHAGVLSLPLTRKNTTSAATNRYLRGRSSGFTELLSNHVGAYMMNINIGTPPQNFDVQIDTGSSDLIVETPSSKFCQANNGCNYYGAYVANRSSTYTYLNSNLVATFGVGSASGDYATDIFQFNYQKTPLDLQFGIMYSEESLHLGICGVGFTNSEAQANRGSPSYDNLPAILVKSGLIASRAYSLWLGDRDIFGGQILFGGVNTAKYIGDLVTFDLVPGPVSTVVDQFFIPMLGVQITGADGITYTPSGGAAGYDVLLDSGTTLVLLPQALTNAIYGLLDVSYQGGTPIVDCRVSMSRVTINFIFTGITIKVPMSQMVLPYSNLPSGYCGFGIGSSDGLFPILGDTFLTSTYVVYDLDNSQASIAVSNRYSGQDHILPIVAGPNGVPHSPGVSPATFSRPSSSMSTTSSSSSAPMIVTSSSSSSSSSSAPMITTSSSFGSFSSSSSSSSSSKATMTSMATSTKTTLVSRATSASSLKGPVCNKDNCRRAFLQPSATAFCSSLAAGQAVVTPVGVAKGCGGLASRVSSACACLPTS